jgi:PAS domain S-box-containing protein
MKDDQRTKKQIEQARRDAEEKYRVIFENAIEGIFQTTMDGHFMSANPALANIFGYDSYVNLIESVTDIGRQLYVNHENREEHLRLIDEKGHVKNFETQMYRKDGSICWVSINTRLVRNVIGEPMHYEGFLTDITERKQAEADKEKMEYQNRQLKKTESLGRMAGAIAHHFNNQMGVVIPFLNQM